MNRNYFIAFEGIDGSGKSTQAKLLAQRFRDIGHKVHTTFEPTDSLIGSMIRNIMKGRLNADHRTIAGLFVADRLDHLLNEVNGILKKLQEGFTVITDRYYFSSYAYHGTHMDMDWVIKANAMSAEILKPHVNLFIDVSPETCMRRINENRSIVDLYETIENLNTVKQKYFEAFDKLKDEESIVVINGDRALNEISTDIWNVVQNVVKPQEIYA